MSRCALARQKVSPALDLAAIAAGSQSNRGNTIESAADGHGNHGDVQVLSEAPKSMSMARRLLFVLLAAAASAQSNPTHSSVVDLPNPSGPYAVGRVSYDWVDLSRPEVLSQIPNTFREIVVDVWYPAAPPKRGAPTAPYFPDAKEVDKSSAAKFEMRWWGSAWPAVVSCHIRSHSYENAPVVAGETRFPLIMFSPGYSVEPLGYTHQIEELVSHGYVVATIHHTYEVAVVRFAGGRMIPFSVENSRGQDAATVEEYVKWEKSRMDTWAADISFTLGKITKLNASSGRMAPYAGRIDIQQVGAFGHSFGGLAAARACALDRRILACLNQDGIGWDGSIPHYGEGHLPAHPYMFMSARLPPPTDKDGIEQHAKMDRELEQCPLGAYEVRIGSPGFQHMGFADFSLLQAAGNPEEANRALTSLRVVEAYTHAFFEKFLKGAHDTLLDTKSPGDGTVEIRRFSH
jgi:predicted dienelactone hydrolase